MKRYILIKGMVFLMLLILIIISLSVEDEGVASSPSPGRWTTQFVEPLAWFAYPSNKAIAVDREGNPHLVYGRGHLFYARYDNGWQTEIVDTSLIQGPSIAIGPSNEAHISYYDTTNHALKYATNDSGSWTTETIDSAGDVGEYTSIAVDGSGKVHISYRDVWQNNYLKYATNVSGSWITQTIDSKLGGNIGKYTSIAVDGSGKVHISYYEDLYNDNIIDALKYATNVSGSWTTQTINRAADVGKYNSIAVIYLLPVTVTPDLQPVH